MAEASVSLADWDHYAKVIKEKPPPSPWCLLTYGIILR